MFGQYMTPVISAEGDRISWVNYKTGEKNIFFRLSAENTKASVSIELTHNDATVRHLYFEQFLQLKKFLPPLERGEWFWRADVTDDRGKTVSRIYTELLAVSVYKKEDWPAMISFFKTTIIALDEFWSNVKYSFEALR